jgi:hypothetical protein
MIGMAIGIRITTITGITRTTRHTGITTIITIQGYMRDRLVTITARTKPLALQHTEEIEMRSLLIAIVACLALSACGVGGHVGPVGAGAHIGSR